MSEQNKTLSRRAIEEAFNKGNLSVVDELYTSDYVIHDAPPGLSKGPEGLKQFVGMYRTGFPDLYSKVEEQIADGDKVATRWSAQGTNTGSLFGMPATGKRMAITGITIDRIANGKIAETWNAYDQLGMMQQLGLAPKPG